MSPTKAKAIIMLLHHKYQPLFQFGKEIKPLQAGVDKLIDAAEFKLSKTQLRHALAYYTNNFYYLQAIKHSEYRYNIDGTQGDKIDEAHKTFAIEKISAMKEARVSKQQVAVKKQEPSPVIA